MKKIYSLFDGCKSLKTVNLPASIEEIGFCAFEDCKCLASITIPDSIKEINNRAFKGCTNLSHVNIPDAMTPYLNISMFEGTRFIESFEEDMDSVSSKNKKAKELGIKIISELEFLKLFYEEKLQDHN